MRLQQLDDLALDPIRALHLLADDGDLPTVKAIIESGRAKVTDSFNGLTALHLAARGGWVELCNYLITKGASVNAPDSKGLVTPLHEAAKCKAERRWEVIELLLSHMADPTLREIGDQTSFHILVRSQPSERMLVAIWDSMPKPVDVDDRDGKGRTPLMLALANEDPYSAAFLLKRGASISVTDKTGRAPLHHAAMGGSLACIRLLLRKGADISVRNRKGKTPLDLAIDCDRFRCTQARGRKESPALDEIQWRQMRSVPKYKLEFYNLKAKSAFLLAAEEAGALNRCNTGKSLANYDKATVEDALLPSKATENQPPLYDEAENLLYDATQDKSVESQLLTLQGDVADTVCWVIQQELDYPTSMYKYHRALRSLLIKLAVKANIIPSYLLLDLETVVYQSPSHKNDLKTKQSNSGGFGFVVYAKYKQSDVALKGLKTDFIDPHSKEYFKREVIIWKQLKHPNVIPFIGVWQPEKPINGISNFMVSPWMENKDMRVLIREYAEAPELIPHDRWLLEVAEGLRYLHQEGIVHGDLRADNVLINNDNHACLTDFGLSGYVHSGTATLGECLSHGNPRFTPPELLTGLLKRPNPASDIYTFSLLCIEVYTCTLPFPEYIINHQVAYQVASHNLRPSQPLGEMGKAMKDNMWKLVQECWNVVPSERPEAEVIVSELKRLSESKEL